MEQESCAKFEADIQKDECLMALKKLRIGLLVTELYQLFGIYLVAF